MDPSGISPLRRLAVIGGVPVDDLTMSEALDRLASFVASRQPHQVATVNLDFIVKAQEDPELLHILQDSDLLTADGMPVVWGARLLGLPIKERVAGSDLVPLLAERGAKEGWRFYFLGGAPGIAKRAAEILRNRFPGLKVAGVHSPALASVVEMPLDIVHRVREAQPDILLVAFGNPKQEKWIHMHLHRLDVPVAMGVGGTLDFIAGTQRRAPGWMQITGTEWTYRLLQDPKRMWRRYMSGIFHLGPVFGRQWIRQSRESSLLQHDQSLKIGVTPGPEVAIFERRRNSSEILEIKIRYRGPMAADCWKVLPARVQSSYRPERLHGRKPLLLLQMEDIRLIDSVGFGNLVQMTRQARAAGGDLYLEGVTPSIRRTISQLKLDRFLTLVDSPWAADSVPSPAGQWGELRDGAGWKVLVLPFRLDVERVEWIRRSTEGDWLNENRLLLDLSQCIYIDSAGIAWLHSAVQKIRGQGGVVRVSGIKADVKRMLERSGVGRDFLLRDSASPMLSISS